MAGFFFSGMLDKTANACYNYFRTFTTCGRGGIGIRARLRGVSSNGYGFKSRRPHFRDPLFSKDPCFFVLFMLKFCKRSATIKAFRTEKKRTQPVDCVLRGELGIRTLGEVSPHTRFPVVRLRPLSQLSTELKCSLKLVYQKS